MALPIQDPPEGLGEAPAGPGRTPVTPKCSGMGFALSHPGIPTRAAFHYLSLSQGSSDPAAPTPTLGCGWWESRCVGMAFPAGGEGHIPAVGPKAPAAQLSLPQLPSLRIPAGITHTARPFGCSPGSKDPTPPSPRLPSIPAAHTLRDGSIFSRLMGCSWRPPARRIPRAPASPRLFQAVEKGSGAPWPRSAHPQPPPSTFLWGHPWSGDSRDGGGDRDTS